MCGVNPSDFQHRDIDKIVNNKMLSHSLGVLHSWACPSLNKNLITTSLEKTYAVILLQIILSALESQLELMLSNTHRSSSPSFLNLKYFGAKISIHSCIII